MLLPELTAKVFRGSQNLVLTAPTSAGKTTIFELALMKMVKEWEGYPEKRLAIYIAPTKVRGRSIMEHEQA